MRTTRMRILGPQPGNSETCAALLAALPDWFGIPQANETYARTVAKLPTFIAINEDTDETLGLLSILHHFKAAAEIHLIVVRPEHHHHGIGRALVDAAETWLRGKHVRYLQVKTLSPRREDEHYARTRRFYEAVGFSPFEEMPTLWGEANPCLIMIKSL